jgi:hypothetical protein
MLPLGRNSLPGKLQKLSTQFDSTYKGAHRAPKQTRMTRLGQLPPDVGN